MRATDDLVVKAVGSIIVAGTATQGPDVECRGVSIIAMDGNTGIIYIGKSNAVTSVNGWPLAAGREAPFLPVKNLSDLWFIAAVATETLRYITY